MFKKGLVLKAIIIRESNPFADCNFEKLPKELYDLLNHDYKLLHDLIEATVSGNFPEELAIRSIGHPHPARKMTNQSLDHHEMIDDSIQVGALFSSLQPDPIFPSHILT